MVSLSRHIPSACPTYLVIVDTDLVGITDSHLSERRAPCEPCPPSARSVLLPQTLRISRCYFLANSSLL